jgi:hypothetical protein
MSYLKESDSGHGSMSWDEVETDKKLNILQIIDGEVS